MSSNIKSTEEYDQDGEPFEEGDREAFWLPIFLGLAVGLIILVVGGLILGLSYWLSGGFPFSWRLSIITLVSISFGFGVWAWLCLRV